jgi:hypothetical protein
VPGARLMGGGGAGGAAAGNTMSSSGSLFGGAAGGGGGGSVGEVEAAGGGGSESELVNAPWCDRIALQHQTAMVLAMFQVRLRLRGGEESYRYWCKAGEGEGETLVCWGREGQKGEGRERRETTLLRGGGLGGGKKTWTGAWEGEEAAGDVPLPAAWWLARHHPNSIPTATASLRPFRRASRQGHVYGFDIMTGTCLSSYTGLYSQPVTSCVFVPDSDLLYTTAMDTCAVVRGARAALRCWSR